jgi:hypothetical protein
VQQASWGFILRILAGLILRAWRHKQEKNRKEIAPDWRAKVSARRHRFVVTAG